VVHAAYKLQGGSFAQQIDILACCNMGVIDCWHE